MARLYSKPLAHGGHRLIPRRAGGQFTRFSLGAECCAHCRAFILPEMQEANGFVTKVWPEKCHQCGNDWRTKAPAAADEPAPDLLAHVLTCLRTDCSECERAAKAANAGDSQP